MGTISFCKSLILFSAITVVGNVAAQESAEDKLYRRYGVASFKADVGDYLGALSELAVIKHLDVQNALGYTAKMKAGQINISFGMADSAEAIFSQILDSVGSEGQKNTSLQTQVGDQSTPLKDHPGESQDQPIIDQKIRNTAWFNLAKLNYLQGQWNNAEKVLGKINGEIDPQVKPELDALRINLEIRQNRFSAALTVFAETDSLDEWLPYIYYNLGNAYSRFQNYFEANKYYDLLTTLPVNRSPVQREEYLALYDKGLTASGYTYIFQGQPDKAIERFSRVRLNSDFSDQALLGYGWAAVEKRDFALAIQPWRELSERALVYPATQEAFIALPFAYESLGAAGDALNAYLDAETVFSGEIARIDNVIATLSQLNFVSALNVQSTGVRNWLRLDVDNSVKPQLTYLNELFSLNRFQSAVQELRDLVLLSRELDNWKQKLAAYRFMIDDRLRQRQRQLQQLREQNLNFRLQALTDRRNQMQSELNRVVAERDVLAMVNPDEIRAYNLLQQVENSIVSAANKGEPVSRYVELYRRYRGLLIWATSVNFDERVAGLQQNIDALSQAIADTQINLLGLNETVVALSPLEPYYNKMTILNERIEVKKRQLTQAIDIADSALRREIIAELGLQKSRLRTYLSQARLSIARLYDASLREK